MKLQALFAGAAFVCTLVYQPASSAGLFDMMSRMASPSLMACRAECSNNDGDDLFPQGTFNGACIERCRGGKLVALPNPGVRPSGNNRAFILLEPMIYVIGDTKSFITIPAGFVTDYASIPRPLWGLYSPHDQYSRAAIVHDYLYWSQLCTRDQADNLFMIAMKESDVPVVTREIVYLGVHERGQSSWDDNRRERQDGMPRVVPLTRKDFPPNWTWEMYREYLWRQSVRDPVFKGDAYCALGNTNVVPTSTAQSDKQIPQPRLAVRAVHGIDQLRLLRGPSIE